MLQLGKGVFTLTTSSGIVTLVIGIGLSTCAGYVFAQQVARLEALRVDELTAPLGIDDPLPRFSWQLRDGRQGARQTAYRIQVASRPGLLVAGKTDVWDSGQIKSSQSVAVAYRGPELLPSTRYFWNVQVWDQAGQQVQASKASW